MIKDIAEVEGYLSRVQCVLPKAVVNWLDETTSIKAGESIFEPEPDASTVEIEPFNPDDNKLPNCLKKAIYQFLMDRKQTCVSTSANSGQTI